jgi:hypothetical protein
MPRIRLVPDRLDQETIHVHFPHTIGIGAHKTTRYPVACSIRIEEVEDIFGSHVADIVSDCGETYVDVEANPVFDE